ncbi:MAG: hypothetical protein AAFR61_24865 [Bacteroidota bacterium]
MYNRFTTFILYGFLLFLMACKPEIPSPIDEDAEINENHPFFSNEDSCRLVPMPPTGPLMEYNDFPDPFLTKTIANNPDNTCQYLSLITGTDPLDQFYMMVDICKQTLDLFQKLPPGTNGLPLWIPNDWFLLVIQRDIWKMKSNGDSLQLVYSIPGNQNIFVFQSDPTDSKHFHFYEGITAYRGDIEGNKLDTLHQGYRLSSNGTKGLGSINGESVGYYDLTQNGLYIPVSTKYKRALTGNWHPDGKHQVWLLMEEPTSHPISLVIIDVETKEERLIKSFSCYNRDYSRLSVTPNGKWVYMHLQYAESLGGRDIFADWFTTFINIESGEEYWGSFDVP